MSSIILRNLRTSEGNPSHVNRLPKLLILDVYNANTPGKYIKMNSTLYKTGNFYGARDMHILFFQNGLFTNSEMYMGVVTYEMCLESH